jgi:3-isopropylmalate dehydrogenase
MKIVMIAGDGIGPEISAANKVVLEAADSIFKLNLQIEDEIAGHESLQKYGSTVRDELLQKVNAADGLILGPMSTYDFKDESKGEINPSKFFRKSLDLYANIRPAKTYPGLKAPVHDFDLVVVRENTEGFYADRNMAEGNGEILVTPDVAISLRRITRQCCERIARSAFELARSRNKHVTIVHKANVLKIADGMFISICHEVAKEFPEVKVDDYIVDAMAAHLVRAPQNFDVIVTTNMFGDILSDLTAELSGSLGLAASVNAGISHAMAQAAHGSAPDIAGKNIANPFSLILSSALLLDWFSHRSNKPEFALAAKSIMTSVEQAILAQEVTRDIGGTLGTAQVGNALAKRLHSIEIFD